MNKKIDITYEVFTNSSELNDIEQELYESAKLVRERAYAPYSDFLVGCAVLLKNGKIITGNNQENAAFPVGTCAERVALNWASANFPNESIQKIFIVGAPKDITKKIKAVPPCGTCRQAISEYENKQKSKIEIYFGSLSGEIFKVNSIQSMLPFSFNSDFL